MTRMTTIIIVIIIIILIVATHLTAGLHDAENVCSEVEESLPEVALLLEFHKHI